MNVPRGSDADHALFRVDALVDSQVKCSALFVTRLSIAGQWLETMPTLTFSAGTGPAGQPGGAGLQVGNSSFLTVEEVVSRVPLHMMKLTTTNAINIPTLANKHETFMTASLRLGPGLRLTVSWVLERTADATLAASLWASVVGLSAVHHPIGGLLGMDDYHIASMQ